MAFLEHNILPIVVQDYDETTDTATVDLSGLGIYDVFIDGIQIHESVDRAQLGAGSKAHIHVIDINRLCESILIGAPGTRPTATSPPAGSNPPPAPAGPGSKLLTGRSALTTAADGGDGAGNPASVTIPFPLGGFSNIPAVLATIYHLGYQLAAHQTAVTSSYFTITFWQLQDRNTTYYVLWQASGNQ